MEFWKLHKVSILISSFSVLFYVLFAYDLIRTDHLNLISLYTALFFMFILLMKQTNLSIKTYAWIAFSFRAVFLLSIPNLSQDFYRFIWDGRLILEGLNPYLLTPDHYIQNGNFPIEQAQALYDGMGALSSGHFSNYPPINQLCFVIASIFSGNSILGSVVVLRLLIIAADFGTLRFGIKLLEHLNLPSKSIFWYILNPFIIIELTGNLHFEAVMIFFLIWSLYLIHTNKWIFAALIFSLSVSIKLIPLIFLPLFIQKLGWKKSLGFYSIVGLITVILFLPFYSNQFIGNYADTVGLWFQTFEFNASIYYLARELGFLFRGWNEIAIIGLILPMIVFIFVISISLFRKNKTTKELITAMLIASSFYLFMATTVHPWYIAMPLILTVFTGYKFPIVWSAVIILSYLAYEKTGYSENLGFVLLEYIIVYGYFIWEMIFKSDNTFSALQKNDL